MLALRHRLPSANTEMLSNFALKILVAQINSLADSNNKESESHLSPKRTLRLSKIQQNRRIERCVQI